MENQAAVLAINETGPLPESGVISEEQIEKFSRLIDETTRPISDDDAEILVRNLGPDECYGLIWDLIHIIETAPNWPNLSLLRRENSYGIDILRQRCRNSGYEI